MTAVGFEVWFDGAWNDLVATAEVRSADGTISVRRGDGTVGTPVAPATATARLDNTTDRLRPSNPLSPLYETAGVGTPLRISRDDDVRGHVQASQWSADESPEFRRTPKRGKAWVDVEGAGLLQQIVASPRLDSPIIRGTRPLDFLIDFWPCEDESGASRLTNLVEGGAQARWAGGDLTLGSDDRPGGAARTVLTPSGVRVFGAFQSATGDGTGWTAVFAAKLPATMSATYQEFQSFTDTTGRRWVWEVNNANYRIQVYDSDGATLETRVGTYSTGPAGWARYSLTVSASGGTVSYETVWRPESGVGIAGFTDSFAGAAAGLPRSWDRPANAYTVDGGLCSVYGVASTVVEGTVYLAFDGYLAEPAAWRFARLMTELGYAWSWIGDPDDSMPMGPQPAETMAEILREIRDTEDGLIYDSRTLLEVVMMTRNARYNQTPIAVDVTDLVARPREVTDAAFANTITVGQRDGGEAVAVDVDGPLGTTAKGPYDQKVDVNVSDERLLAAIANWRLRRGTVNQPRYPTIEVNLFALGPARAAQLAAVDVGQALQITGIRADPVRVHVLTIAETIGWPNGWALTLTCEPDDVFQVGVYDESAYDSRSTTLAAAAEIGAGSLSLTTVRRGDVWSTTATPELTISGERVRVTSMGAVSGTGPYLQTATVVRSRNDIAKRLPAGAQVHVADPVRYALSGEGSMAAGDVIFASDFDRPLCRLVQQTLQSIGTADTTLTFGASSENYDPYALHDEVTNNSRITFDRAGIWLVKGTVFVASNTAVTSLVATISINGGVIPARSKSKPAATAVTMSQEVTEIVSVSAGDYAELLGQCTGSATNSNVGSSFASTFMARYLGPS